MVPRSEREPGPTLRAYASLDGASDGPGPRSDPTSEPGACMTNPAAAASVAAPLPAARSDLPRSRKRFSVRELPVADRPRERLREHGAHALSSAELLAILLGAGSGGRSAL